MHEARSSFQDGNDISHDCVIFQGVLSRTLVLPSREVEGKAFREDEQLIYANDFPPVTWIADLYSFH